MGVTFSNKELSVSQIECEGTFNITLSLTAEPDIVSNPTDIVLVLDRSGSMAGSPLANLKLGAKKFIQIIDEATDSAQDGQIGSGSRIGIVSFAGNAVQDAMLETSVSALNSVVDSLLAGGETNHQDAFLKAIQTFDPDSSNAKVMVMFTDGLTTAGGPPAPVAEAAKAQGIIIYAIGLLGNGGVDEDALEDWASDPSSAYVAIAPDEQALEDIFENLAENISNPGATDIVITDTVAPCFDILSVSTPTKGTATLLNSNAVEWRIDELGTTSSEGAALEFTVRHTGECSGNIEVNESVEYSDNEGNAVSFPSPEIEVDCGSVVIPEECPEPVQISLDGCSDTIEYDAGELELESQGRILQLDVTLKHICPGRRVALAAIVSEVDEFGLEHRRGLKTLVIPSHNSSECRDITVRCIKFVLPEELNVSGTSDEYCQSRNLRARFIAHYIDSGFECCDIIS